MSETNRFVDSHAHLDFPEYASDLEEVLARAGDAGVRDVITVGTGVGSSRRCLEIAARRPAVGFTAGIHPHEASEATPEALREIEALASEGAVAVGEIGLDYYRDRSPRDDQKRAFSAQLEIASRLKLPVVIHSRDSWADTVAVLDASGPRHGVVVHCFSGGPLEAKQAVDRGWFLSFAGPLTYPSAEKARLAAAAVPLDRILLETDSPFLSPQSLRGRRNEPSSVVEIARTQASLHGVNLSDAARITSFAARRLFGVGPEIPAGLIAYPIRDSLYLNITNRCTLNCGFCARRTDYSVAGYSLRLPAEPTVAEIEAALSAAGAPGYREVVFCGFGEPTVRLQELLEVGGRLRAAGLRVRLNTNGTASLLHGRDVTDDLSRAVSDLSVSLNAQDRETYDRICNPTLPGAYEGVLEFLRACRGKFLSVTATAVEGVEGVDAAEVERIALSLGAVFRRRIYQFTG